MIAKNITSVGGAMALKAGVGALTGGGANLANQLISNGGDFSQVNWTSSCPGIRKCSGL